MEKKPFVFSFQNCCTDMHDLLEAAAYNSNLIPVQQFYEHSKECKQCAEVLNSQLKNFINSMPMKFRFIANQIIGEIK